MIGPFITSSPGPACHECGGKIASGAQVFYPGTRLDDDLRTCAHCVDLDLFGGAIGVIGVPRGAVA